MVEEWRKDVVPLAEGILGKDQLVYIRHLSPWSAFEPGNYPILFATHWGKGKAVQFTLNSRVWRNAFFGHAVGWMTSSGGQFSGLSANLLRQTWFPRLSRFRSMIAAGDTSLLMLM